MGSVVSPAIFGHSAFGCTMIALARSAMPVPADCSDGLSSILASPALEPRRNHNRCAKGRPFVAGRARGGARRGELATRLGRGWPAARGLRHGAFHGRDPHPAGTRGGRADADNLFRRSGRGSPPAREIPADHGLIWLVTFVHLSPTRRGR